MQGFYTTKYAMMTTPLDILTANIRLIIFDLDGTIYCKKGIVRRMICAAPRDWRMMLAERKTRKMMRGKWYGSEEVFYQNYFNQMAKYCSRTPEQVCEWYEKKYMPLMVEIIRKHHKTVEWLDPFVNDCQHANVKLMVLSDYGHTQEKLKALGVDQNIFEWIISAPQLGGLKPAPQLINRITEHMEVAAEQCLVIGDRADTDGEMAKKTGAAFCLVNN